MVLINVQLPLPSIGVSVKATKPGDIPEKYNVIEIEQRVVELILTPYHPMLIVIYT
jgi:hypothetical protein